MDGQREGIKAARLAPDRWPEIAEGFYMQLGQWPGALQD